MRFIIKKLFKFNFIQLKIIELALQIIPYSVLRSTNLERDRNKQNNRSDAGAADC